MQLNFEEYKQMLRLVNLVVREAIWDYSYDGDMFVVNINGQPLIFDKSQLGMLKNIVKQIEEEIIK